MSKKYKQIILAIVGLAVLSILLLPNLNLFTVGEEEAADFRDAEDIEEIEADVDVEEIEADVDAEEIEAAEAAEDAAGDADTEKIEFKTTDNPYRAYIEARENGKPIVLEFYAHW